MARLRYPRHPRCHAGAIPDDPRDTRKYHNTGGSPQQGWPSASGGIIARQLASTDLNFLLDLSPLSPP
jgi:hypothetical protein